MSSSTAIHTRRTMRTKRFVLWLSQHWLLVFGVLFGLFVGLPWLAPLFRHWGWNAAATGIYTFYSTQCHQLPQRSFFLFGSQAMYNLDTIQATWQNTDNPLILRQFVGNGEMGWKVAWSDRMVYMYTSVLLGAVLFGLGRKRIKPLSLWGVILFLLPMAVDGFSHLISDATGGIGGGFRDNNAWLAILTNNAFPSTFYVGDALGSFNSWMRFLSGLFFGLGLVWFAFPHLESSFAETVRDLQAQLQPAKARTNELSHEATHPRSISR